MVVNGEKRLACRVMCWELMLAGLVTLRESGLSCSDPPHYVCVLYRDGAKGVW